MKENAIRTRDINSMKFIIVKRKWYHSLLEKFAPKDVAPQYQIHLATIMGEKNGKWHLVEPRYYEFKINNNSHTKATDTDSMNTIIEDWTPRNWDQETSRSNAQHRESMLSNLEKKFEDIRKHNLDPEKTQEDNSCDKMTMKDN